MYKKIKVVLVILFVIILIGAFFWLEKNQKLAVKQEAPTKKDIAQTVSQVLAERKVLPKEKIKELRLERLSNFQGIEGLNETDQYVEEKAVQENSNQITSSQISNYQTFVTPKDAAVMSLAQGKTYQQIYQAALKWVWVEDEIINGTAEKWLYPNFFLTQTPSLATNPVLGRVASDCESQAYTLVSALRAAGMPADNVRVVTGKVNFGGTVGGHAWVEVYDEKAGWFQLEATSGDYYDSQSKKLVSSAGIDYDYFKNYQYPSVVKWTMFNDQYFFDLTRGQGVAPEVWFDEETIKKQDDPAKITYQLPDALKKMREERANSLREELLKMDKKEFQEKINLLKNKKTVTDGVAITGENFNSEQITNQILSVINQLEQAIIQGATAEQKAAFQKAAAEGLAKANQMLAASTQLSAEEKAKIQAMLDEAETLLENGISQVQLLVLKKEALAFLDQLEKDIQSGEIKNKLNEKRGQLQR